MVLRNRTDALIKLDDDSDDGDDDDETKTKTQTETQRRRERRTRDRKEGAKRPKCMTYVPDVEFVKAMT